MYARHITASWVFSMMFWEGDFFSTLASGHFLGVHVQFAMIYRNFGWLDWVDRFQCFVKV